MFPVRFELEFYIPQDDVTIFFTAVKTSNFTLSAVMIHRIMNDPFVNLNYLAGHSFGETTHCLLGTIFSFKMVSL
jgi:hypothetical protein